MSYSHTQTAPLYYLLLGVAAVMLLSAWLTLGEPAIAITLGISGAVVLLLAFCFASLTISDEVDRLSIRFGPLPLFRKSIPYTEITGVEPGRTSFIDGWGIHYVPGRGWTYNLWGFDCAVIHRGTKVIRVGTDDPEDLVAFLQQKCAA